MTTGYQPTSTYSERADDRLHLGLVLTDEEIEATPVNNACEDSDAWVKNGAVLGVEGSYESRRRRGYDADGSRGAANQYGSRRRRGYDADGSRGPANPSGGRGVSWGTILLAQVTRTLIVSGSPSTSRAAGPRGRCPARLARSWRGTRAPCRKLLSRRVPFRPSPPLRNIHVVAAVRNPASAEDLHGITSQVRVPRGLQHAVHRLGVVVQAGRAPQDASTRVSPRLSGIVRPRL